MKNKKIVQTEKKRLQLNLVKTGIKAGPIRTNSLRKSLFTVEIEGIDLRV